MMKLLNYSPGDARGSNHCSQPPAGGLWKCQDCEKRQLFSFCKLLWPDELYKFS